MLGDTIKRTNFDAHWLEIDEVLKHDNFKSIRLKEVKKARKLVKEPLKKAIIEHLTRPKKMQRYKTNSKFAELEAYIAEKMPTADKVRKGDFGEIIGCEHLNQRYNYEFPVFKLRYKPVVNSPMQGEDILGFKMEGGKIQRICVGESKFRSGHESDAVKEAHERLDAAYNPHPTSLIFISEILEDNVETEELADQVSDLISKLGREDFPRDNWIFYITGNRPLDPFKILKNEKNIVKNLIAVNLHLPEPTEFINELFDECKDGL